MRSAYEAFRCKILLRAECIQNRVYILFFLYMLYECMPVSWWDPDEPNRLLPNNCFQSIQITC
ncbi:hypothetical protein Hdeb2414_s0320g00866661 [Helianthus debilis subsp. tardiflorus]